MTEAGNPVPSSKPRDLRGLLFSTGVRLHAPLVSNASPAARRRRMLAWLLLGLLTLTLVSLAAVLAANVLGRVHNYSYVPFIAALDLPLLVAYALNGRGRYREAAGLTVMAALIGPWGAALIDPMVLRGDFVPLAYTMISVLLSSILLTPVITTILAVGQLLCLAMIAYASPVNIPIDWPSFLVLLVCASMLSILASIITADDLELIQAQTQALEESEARLRELSVRDHLTGLFNRRYLEETLAREIRRSARSGYSIGVIMIDLDGFKAVNDQWGHPAGDVLLQEIGQLLMASIRGGDIACRYGGDEFVIVLPEASIGATVERATSLAQAIRSLDAQYHRQALGQLTLSAGAAVYPDHGADMDALLKSADEALYRSKAAGRNGVTTAEDSFPEEP